MNQQQTEPAILWSTRALGNKQYQQTGRGNTKETEGFIFLGMTDEFNALAPDGQPKAGSFRDTTFQDIQIYQNGQQRLSWNGHWKNKNYPKTNPEKKFVAAIKAAFQASPARSYTPPLKDLPTGKHTGDYMGYVGTVNKGELGRDGVKKYTYELTVYPENARVFSTAQAGNNPNPKKIPWEGLPIPGAIPNTRILSLKVFDLKGKTVLQAEQGKLIIGEEEDRTEEQDEILKTVSGIFPYPVQKSQPQLAQSILAKQTQPTAGL